MQVRHLLESRIRDEERLYEAEDIAFEPISYPDNAGVIALMEAPPDGIIPKLFSQLEQTKPSETKVRTPPTTQQPITNNQQPTTNH